MDKLLRFLGRTGRRFVAAILAAAMTLAFFLLLPLMQQISEQPKQAYQTRPASVATPPPPEPPEEEPPEPEEQEEKPEMQEPEPEPLNLQQLEMSLNPGTGGAAGAAMKINLSDKTAGGGASEGLFSMAELDQRPQVTYQPSPEITEAVREASPGTVTVIFIVNKKGRVENVKVKNSTHPALEEPVVEAVENYRFQPGERQGEPVRFRMQRTIRFPDLR
jgi:protein TonB